METKNKPENPSAFPAHRMSREPEYTGMTLRDYFAAKALNLLPVVTKNFDDKYMVNGPYIDVHLLAKDAYELADAVLLKRSEENK